VSSGINFNRRGRLTSISILNNGLPDSTLIGNVDFLGLEVTASSAEAAGGVHCLLEGIALPAKYVIAVLTIAGVISGAKIKGLGAILWPVGLVVELGGVPDDLVLCVNK
jgi:hypothetical protein